MANDFLNEDWNADDNKQYRGKIDRMYVALTEDYEVSYFVDKYLEAHNSPRNEKNRTVIKQVLKRCPLKAPIRREELVEWLDGQVTFG